MLVAAYVIVALTTPADISGAVLLLPFQVRALGMPRPAVTPTNLLYNVVATPGALYRYWRQEQTGGRLALVLIAGTLPYRLEPASMAADRVRPAEPYRYPWPGRPARDRHHRPLPPPLFRRRAWLHHRATPTP